MSRIVVAYPTAHAVWAIVVKRSTAPAKRARVLAAPLVDGARGGHDRDLGAHHAWRNDADSDQVDVLPLQLAGPTIHEATHQLAGPGPGAATPW